MLCVRINKMKNNRQTKKEKFLEATTNIIVGISINIGILQLIIDPLFINVNPDASDSLFISIIYTIVSLIRQYVIRTFFDNKKHKMESEPSPIQS